MLNSISKGGLMLKKSAFSSLSLIQFAKLTTNTTLKNLPTIIATQTNHSQNEYLYDIDTEIIAKRVLLEFKNNDKIFLPKRLSYLIQNLYKPNHLNIDVLNSEIIKFWPSNVEWSNLVSKLDVCIIEANNVNKNAEIQLDLNEMNDILARDIIGNIRGHAKLIAIKKFDQDSNKILGEFDRSDERKLISKRRADIIISNRGVFAFCEKNHRLEMVEYNENFDHRKPLFEYDSFQPFIDRYSIKRMSQECI
jgi:hypothetical protein